jgi:hypothetical protein
MKWMLNIIFNIILGSFGIIYPMIRLKTYT